MKRLSLIVLAVMVLMSTGCASMSNTLNRLQGDVTYFEQKLNEYSILIDGSDSDKAKDVLGEARRILGKAREAVLIGDKITHKKYLSALVDIMAILEAKKAGE